MYINKAYTSYKVLGNRGEGMCIDCSGDREKNKGDLRKWKNVMNGFAKLRKYRAGSENGKVSSQVKALNRHTKSTRQKVKKNAEKDFGSPLMLALGFWALLVGK